MSFTHPRHVLARLSTAASFQTLFPRSSCNSSHWKCSPGVLILSSLPCSFLNYVVVVCLRLFIRRFLRVTATISCIRSRGPLHLPGIFLQTAPGKRSQWSRALQTLTTQRCLRHENFVAKSLRSLLIIPVTEDLSDKSWHCWPQQKLRFRMVFNPFSASA